MQEGLENWTVIQSFNGSGTVRRRLLERMKTYFTWQLRRNRWGNLSSSLLRLAFSGSYYVRWRGGRCGSPPGGITYGTLMAFLQIVSQIRMPLVNMVRPAAAVLQYAGFGGTAVGAYPASG